MNVEARQTAEAARQSAEPTGAQGQAHPQLSGRTLLVARLLWVAVTVLAIVVFSAKVGIIFTLLQHPSQVARAAMAPLGISPAFRTAYTIGVETISALVFFGVAAALARFRSDHLPALLASTALVAYGASGETLDVLRQFDVRWMLPAALLGLIYRITFIVFLYVFPDGQFIPRWTKWLAAIWAVTALLVVLPVGVPLSASHWPPVIGLPLELLTLGSLIYAQAYRYRHVSDESERQQTRWVVYGVAVAMSLGFVAELPRFILPSVSQPSAAGLLYELIFLGVWDLSLMLIPLTIGIAILRHHLYDIDIIINRTLVYGLLTAILAGLFAGTVAMSQKFLIALTGQTSDWTAVLATLLVVAAFTLIKNRLQELVDKRFKEVPDPLRGLKDFGDQVRLRLAPVEARQVMRRLLNEAVAAFDAAGGAAYLERDGQLQLIYTTGEWNGEAKLEMALTTDSERFGVLSLGARHNGRDYTSQDREALQQVAQVVAQAIEQDSQGK